MNRTVSEFDMDECTGLQTYDYFTHSQISFALTFAGAGIWIVGCVAVLHCLVKWRSKKTRVKQKVHHEKYSRIHHITVSGVSHQAAEWCGPKEGHRQVQITLCNGKQIQVNHEDGIKTYRTIDLSMVTDLTFSVSSDRKRQYVMIEVNKEYDLVIRFDNESKRNAFISDFELWLAKPNVRIRGKQMQIREKNLRAMATTKEDRQKTLEKFVKLVFAQVSNLNVDTESDEFRGVKEALAKNQPKGLLAFELTKTEFAETLSMKPDSLFVEKMFELADKTNSGTISFREFLDVLVIFTKGQPEDKMRMMFNMYDLDGSGALDRSKFNTMLKSMMEMVNASLESSQLEKVINSMFIAAGFENKAELTFQDFIVLMAEHKDDFNESALQISGK
ncbi:dual oxidase 2-like [Amphiura filiformis]|uniref:dual oxidase 2-like n=1 Tax=Amphiura filiformis TaxID=82378 RepID=UPI003B218313